MESGLRLSWLDLSELWLYESGQSSQYCCRTGDAHSATLTGDCSSIMSVVW